jgi:hypothetical protein
MVALLVQRVMMTGMRTADTADTLADTNWALVMVLVLVLVLLLVLSVNMSLAVRVECDSGYYQSMKLYCSYSMTALANSR